MMYEGGPHTTSSARQLAHSSGERHTARGSLVRQPPLVDQVRQNILERIESGVYSPGGNIDPEMKLASEFGVSRVTVRRAIDLLVDSGLLVRRQGLGTFFTNRPAVQNPLSQFIDFAEMIFSFGMTPGLIQLSAEIVPAPSDVAQLLELSADGKVLLIHKVFTGDGDPMVYCVNHIPLWVFEGRVSLQDVLSPEVTEPILGFFRTRCAQKVDYYVSTVRAETVRGCGLPYFSSRFDDHLPVLVVDQLGYGDEDRPLHHSVEYHPANRMQFHLARLVGRGTWNGQRPQIERAQAKMNAIMNLQAPRGPSKETSGTASSSHRGSRARR